jgi:hypothetical protein
MVVWGIRVRVVCGVAQTYSHLLVDFADAAVILLVIVLSLLGWPSHSPDEESGPVSVGLPPSC